jgi:hypothetical protein
VCGWPAGTTALRVVVYFEAVKFHGTFPPNRKQLALPAAAEWFLGPKAVPNDSLASLQRGPNLERLSIGDRYDLALDAGHMATMTLTTLVAFEGDEYVGNASYVGALGTSCDPPCHRVRVRCRPCLTSRSTRRTGSPIRRVFRAQESCCSSATANATTSSSAASCAIMDSGASRPPCVEDAPGTQFSRGDVVASVMGGMGRAFDGSYAEYTCVPTEHVQKVETRLPWETLGAIPEMLQTAWGSLYSEILDRAAKTACESVSARG